MELHGRRELEVERFELREAGRRPRVAETLELRPPDSVQAALVRAGFLAPLESEEADRDWGWVPRTAWEATAELEIDEGLASAERLVLECDGLETLAGVRMSRGRSMRRLGRTENGLRPHRFDLTGRAAGPATLAIRFDPLFAELERRNAKRALPGWGVGSDKDDTAAWVRTAPVHMGWDFAPKAVPVGFGGGVRLVGFDRARVDGVRVEQQHRRNRVRLTVTVELERASRGPVDVEAVLGLGGAIVASAGGRTGGRRIELTLDVRDPALWCPNTYGDRPLYALSIFVRADDALLDAWAGRIGLRRIELVRRPDREGQCFWFRVNGRRVDARGANWVPPEPLPGLGDASGRTRRGLEDLAAAGATMVRVWGGGPVADDGFYDHCDRLGLLVWQDFPFACTTYPSFDRAWMDEVERETRHHVRRLRHRASLALWCGNNEVENGLSGPRWTDTRMSWKDYRALFDRLLARVVEREDGETAYWPGSPHSPLGDRMDFNADGSGDAHLWGVWHGGDDFASFAASRHRFVSEYGFQSLPAPATLAARLSPEQRNLSAPAFERRQRAGGGNAKLLDYLQREHRLPRSFGDWCWTTQVLQAEGIVQGVEHWRRNRPRSGGSLIWQWNEPWAAPTWSAIDRDGHAKALFHGLARAWAPVALSLQVDRARGRVAVWAVNDGPAAVEVAAVATPIDLAGRAFADAFQWSAVLASGRSKRLGIVELGREAADAGLAPNQVVLKVVRVGDDGPCQLARIVPWKQLELGDSGLELRRPSGREAGHERPIVELTARAVVPVVWLECGPARSARPVRVRPGDQFAPVLPDRPLRVELGEGISLDELRPAALGRGD